MSVIETRAHQMFPELDAGQIETAKRFASGPGPRIRAAAKLFSTSASGRRLPGSCSRARST